MKPLKDYTSLKNSFWCLNSPWILTFSSLICKTQRADGIKLQWNSSFPLQITLLFFLPSLFPGGYNPQSETVGPVLWSSHSQQSGVLPKNCPTEGSTTAGNAHDAGWHLWWVTWPRSLVVWLICIVMWPNCEISLNSHQILFLSWGWGLGSDLSVMWHLFLPSVPSFVVRFNNVRIHTSKVYENLRKTDTIVDLTLPQPVPLCGDIKIELFHNTRTYRKVLIPHCM